MTCKPNNANSINKYSTGIVIASTFQVVKSLSIFPISHPLFRISSKNKNIVIIYWIPNDRAGDEPHFSVLPFLRDEPRQHKNVVQASQIPTKPQYLPFQCNLTFTQKTQTNVNGGKKGKEKGIWDHGKKMLKSASGIQYYSPTPLYRSIKKKIKKKKTWCWFFFSSIKEKQRIES